MLAALILGAAPVPLRAAEVVVFDLTIRGLEAAVLSFDGQVKDGRYAVTGRVESAGLVGLFRQFRYDASSRGSLRGGRFVPQSYVESADTGQRKSTAEMLYRRGVPQIKAHDPPRAADGSGVDPATQGGTVDPLTAMFAALRDAPEGRECNQTLTMFDGERRSQIQIGAPIPADGGALACPGEYRRLEGFSEKEMAERSRFPFTMILSPPEAGLRRVTEVRMETLYGRAALKRRKAGG